MTTSHIILDRAAFFSALRDGNSGLFSSVLTSAQVEGTEALLDAADRHGVHDIEHVAHILAEVYHETGRYMLGIKETVMPSHSDKCPSDATVIARLDKAWKAGSLPWVKTPYWRDGAFGRGPIQITHWYNYEKLGALLGVNLRQKPDLALDAKIGADIAVVGLSQGVFTGKKLQDFKFPEALKAIPKQHPRRMVNGIDGTDAHIAKYHECFRKALNTAGFKIATITEPEVAQTQIWRKLLNFILKLLGA